MFSLSCVACFAARFPYEAKLLVLSAEQHHLVRQFRDALRLQVDDVEYVGRRASLMVFDLALESTSALSRFIRIGRGLWDPR